MRLNENKLNNIFDKLYESDFFGVVVETKTDKLGFYINLAIDQGIEDYDQAKSIVENNIAKLKNLPNEITLYRVIFVNSLQNIDKDKVGSHYVMRSKDLENSHYVQSHVGGGEPYILKVKAPKDSIDFHETLVNNIKYPHEKEITLKNKGQGAKIIKISEFSPTPSAEDDFLYGGGFEDFY